METLMTGWAWAFIIKTFIDIIKPMIPDSKKGLIPYLAGLMGILYAYVTVEWTVEMKIAAWIGIWSSATASHEAGKLLKKEAAVEQDMSEYDAFPQESYPNQEPWA